MYLVLAVRPCREGRSHMSHRPAVRRKGFLEMVLSMSRVLHLR